MKEFKARIDFLDWDIQMVILSDEKDNINKFKSQQNIPDEEIKEIKDNLRSKCEDGGVTFTNYSIRKIVIFIYPHKTELKMLDTISHEIYHVVKNVTKNHDIVDSETPAYLTGYLSSIFIPKVLSIKLIE